MDDSFEKDREFDIGERGISNLFLFFAVFFSLGSRN